MKIIKIKNYKTRSSWTIKTLFGATSKQYECNHLTENEENSIELTMAHVYTNRSLCWCVVVQQTKLMHAYNVCITYSIHFVSFIHLMIWLYLYVTNVCEAYYALLSTAVLHLKLFEFEICDCMQSNTSWKHCISSYCYVNGNCCLELCFRWIQQMMNMWWYWYTYKCIDIHTVWVCCV